MKSYEILYLIRPNLAETELQQLLRQLNNVFTTRESVVNQETLLGLKELAYPIQKFTKGYYVSLMVTAIPSAIQEFQRVVGLNENILRWLVICTLEKQKGN